MLFHWPRPQFSQNHPASSINPSPSPFPVVQQAINSHSQQMEVVTTRVCLLPAPSLPLPRSFLSLNPTLSTTIPHSGSLSLLPWASSFIKLTHDQDNNLGVSLISTPGFNAYVFCNFYTAGNVIIPSPGGGNRYELTVGPPQQIIAVKCAPTPGGNNNCLPVDGKSRFLILQWRWRVKCRRKCRGRRRVGSEDQHVLMERQQPASGAVSTIPGVSCLAAAVDYAWAQNAEILTIHEREDTSLKRRKALRY